MRVSLGTWMAASLALALVGCGGAQKTESRSGEEAAEEASADSSGGKNVNPETFDELTRLFNNKRPQVGRCYSDAVQSGKLDKKAKGRVTVALSISADGKAQSVKTSEDTLKSPDVETCVIDLIKTWDLPEPGDSCEFSFSYDFEPE
jgi:hypothetical protein